MQKDLEALKSAKSELEARAKVRKSETYDSGMPVVEGTILSIIGYKTENKGLATEYTNFVNEEGAILSDKHISRRGNGLDLEGDTNLARTLSFMDEVDKAENPIKIKIVKILSRKALYDGRETLNNYYVMQRL
jgi:hypothetical protein